MAYLGAFEQVILYAIVRLGDDAYGVTIRETIEARTGKLPSSGSIYTVLGRLEERSFVTSSLGEPTPGRAGRPRKYYALTPDGARALQASYSTIQAMAGGLASKLVELAEQ